MLNEQLYNALVDYCTRTNQSKPTVNNRNLKMQSSTTTTFNSSGQLVTRCSIGTPGEEYVINCPFCGDTRHRLTINHKWGVVDADTGNYNLWLMHCYNENCEEEWKNQHDLYYMLFGPDSVPVNSEDMKAAYRGVGIDEMEVHVIDLPDDCVKLNSLESDHPAVVYMQNRGYDIDYLSEAYNFMFCNYSPMPLVSQRIIMPVYNNELLVGWQARYVGNIQDINSKGYRIPKYYTSKGFRTSQFSFNFDVAKKYKTIVITEGILDAINTGPYAIGVFGKSVSDVMRANIIRSMRKNNGSIVVMLDPQKSPDNFGEHHIEKTARQFASAGVPIAKVYLPPFTDPGSCPREEIKRNIIAQSKEQYVKVDFSLA